MDALVAPRSPVQGARAARSSPITTTTSALAVTATGVSSETGLTAVEGMPSEPATAEAALFSPEAYHTLEVCSLVPAVTATSVPHPSFESALVYRPATPLVWLAFATSTSTERLGVSPDVFGWLGAVVGGDAGVVVGGDA